MDLQLAPRKRKMKEHEEMEYYRYLRFITEDHKKGLTQASILAMVNSDERFQRFKIQQSELSKDLKYAQLVAVKEQGVMVYRHKALDPLEGLPKEFEKYLSGEPALFNKPKCLKIPVSEGYEIVACKEIIAHFKPKHIICIPAYKSVCIISNSKDAGIEKVKEIKEKLSIIHNHRNK